MGENESTDDFQWFVVVDYGYEGKDIEEYKTKDEAEEKVNRLMSSKDIDSLDYVIYGRRVQVVANQWRIEGGADSATRPKVYPVQQVVYQPSPDSPVRQALWEILCSMVDDPDDDDEVNAALSRLRSAT